jgi:hypothetical protein
MANYLLSVLRSHILIISVLLGSCLIAVYYLCREPLRKAHEWVRKKAGGGWIIVRVVIAVGLTMTLVRYEEFLSQSYKPFSSWVGKDLLAFLAITFAVVQFLDAREEEKGMGKIEHRMQKVLDNASTRPVGSFPFNLRKIIDMVKGARSSIRIIVDFPGYGMYSDPDLYAEYLEALKAAGRNADVEFQMVSYDKTLTLEDTEHEFPRMPDPTDKKFLRFFEGVSSKELPQDVPALAKCLQNRQTASIATLETLVQHRDGLQRGYLSVRAPLCLWLIDDREVIFTFKNLENNNETYSIRSSDDDLVRHFIGYFKQEFKHTAKDYEPKLTLRNVIGTLADGADVTVRGKYRASDQTINVSNVKVGPAP